MRSLKWILVVAAIAGLAVAGYYIANQYSQNEKAAPLTAAELEKFPEVALGIADCPSKGAEDGYVSVVEFTDFQCPFCKRANTTMDELFPEYQNDVKFYACMNALSFHQRATPAGIAAYAAHRQGKYWEFHAKCFENNKNLEDADFQKYAQEIGLNMEQFNKDLKDPALAALVKKHSLTAGALGQTGAPAFFINGELVVGAQPIEKFKEVIDKHLEKAKKIEARGVPMKKIHAVASWNAQNNEYRRVIFYGSAPAAKKEPPALSATPQRIEVLDSPRKGTGDKVVVTLFCDFQCPYCKSFVDTADEVVAHYGSDASLVFKHLALSFHQQAHKAAEASMAALSQGKFWEFYKLTFERQADLKTDGALGKIAADVGLDMDRFNKEMAGGRYEERVDQDLRMAQKLNVRGTPTFFINGRRWQASARDTQTIIQVIDKEILKK